MPRDGRQRRVVRFGGSRWAILGATASVVHRGGRLGALVGLVRAITAPFRVLASRAGRRCAVVALVHPNEKWPDTTKGCVYFPYEWS
jgi:hypothetical protein